jgi:hypothetical protein
MSNVNWKVTRDLNGLECIDFIQDLRASRIKGQKEIIFYTDAPRVSSKSRICQVGLTINVRDYEISIV